MIIGKNGPETLQAKNFGIFSLTWMC